MDTIWKYQLERTDEQTINVPEGAVPLKVSDNMGWPTLWCQVDTDNAIQTARIFIYGTGHPIQGISDLLYLGTTMDSQMPLISHIFTLKDGPLCTN